MIHIATGINKFGYSVFVVGSGHDYGCASRSVVVGGEVRSGRIVVGRSASSVVRVDTVVHCCKNAYTMGQRTLVVVVELSIRWRQSPMTEKSLSRNGVSISPGKTSRKGNLAQFVIHVHQQFWRQLFLILYPLFITFSQIAPDSLFYSFYQGRY